jgi:hypothetical protein
VRVHDASAERKTAENLFALLEDVLKNVQEEWGVIAVAVVTDASGESRKARRMLGKKYPSLVVIDCYSHQVSRRCVSVIADILSCLWFVAGLDQPRRRGLFQSMQGWPKIY